MNRKLIFEATNLPGGLVFTQVVEAAGKGPLEHRGDEIARRTGLRFKGSEPTSAPVSGLRFAPEALDLSNLIDTIVSKRPPLARELNAMLAVLRAIGPPPARLT